MRGERSMSLNEDEIHEMLNHLGIVKNNAELLLIGKYKQATEQGRKDTLNSIISKVDKLITVIRSKSPNQKNATI